MSCRLVSVPFRRFTAMGATALAVAACAHLRPASPTVAPAPTGDTKAAPAVAPTTAAAVPAPAKPGSATTCDELFASGARIQRRPIHHQH